MCQSASDRLCVSVCDHSMILYLKDLLRLYVDVTSQACVDLWLWLDCLWVSGCDCVWRACVTDCNLMHMWDCICDRLLFNVCERLTEDSRVWENVFHVWRCACVQECGCMHMLGRISVTVCWRCWLCVWLCVMMQCVHVTLVCVCMCVYEKLWLSANEGACVWRWTGWGQCRIKRRLVQKGLPNPILIRNRAAVSLNRHCTTADVLISSALWFTWRSPITQLLIEAYLSQVFSLLP